MCEKRKAIKKTYRYPKGLIHEFEPNNDGGADLWTGNIAGPISHTWKLEIERVVGIEFSCLYPVNPKIGMPAEYLKLVAESLEKYLKEIDN